MALSPEHFHISTHEPPARPWRASLAERYEWQTQLRRRIAEQAALENALSTSVTATEEIALPILRDALLGPTADPETLGDVADELTQRLLVDLRHSGVGQTTRAMEAIETLQGVVNSVHGTGFEEIIPQKLGLFNNLRSRTATAMRSKSATLTSNRLQWDFYENWQAASDKFYYPENGLLPSLVWTLAAQVHLVHRTKNHPMHFGGFCARCASGSSSRRRTHDGWHRMRKKATTSAVIASGSILIGDLGTSLLLTL